MIFKKFTMNSKKDSSSQLTGLLIKVDNALGVDGHQKVRCVLTDTRAVVPTRGSGYAAGLDLAPFLHGIVEAKRVVIVNIGVAVEIPRGYYGRIATRSSVLIRGITISGDIDNDYRGEIKLIIVNNTDFPFILKAGVPVAHLIIKPYLPSNVVLVQHLPETDRGSNGFGSTSTTSNQYIVDNKEPMIYTKIMKDALNPTVETSKKEGDQI